MSWKPSNPDAVHKHFLSVVARAMSKGNVAKCDICENTYQETALNLLRCGHFICPQHSLTRVKNMEGLRCPLCLRAAKIDTRDYKASAKERMLMRRLSGAPTQQTNSNVREDYRALGTLDKKPLISHTSIPVSSANRQPVMLHKKRLTDRLCSVHHVIHKDGRLCVL